MTSSTYEIILQPADSIKLLYYYHLLEHEARVDNIMVMLRDVGVENACKREGIDNPTKANKIQQLLGEVLEGCAWQEFP